MKQRLYLLLFISVSFFFITCKKDKPAIDQLPPATQTGAGTFGCIVNGKVFKPKGDIFSGPILSCANQYINGGYYFQLTAISKGSSTNYSIGIFADSLKIENNVSYTLKTKNKREGIYGLYSISEIQGLINYMTDDRYIGELKITKLDEINRTVSGTFWFDAVDTNGGKVEVREGRFDMPYTL